MFHPLNIKLQKDAKRKEGTMLHLSQVVVIYTREKASLADSRHIKDTESLWKRFIQWPRPVIENLLRSRRQPLTAGQEQFLHSLTLPPPTPFL